MAILNWGKCKLETTPSVNGAPAPSAQWKAIDTPKNGTTKIETTAGNEVEALEEGGGVVDVRTETNKYKLEFDLTELSLENTLSASLPKTRRPRGISSIAPR